MHRRPQKDRVTDGHWWVKWVSSSGPSRLRRVVATPHWRHNRGDGSGRVETGAAIGCHGREWKDAHGDTWTGVALYLLCGQVDDDNPHTGPAYNRELANAGCEVELLATDGAPPS